MSEVLGDALTLPETPIPVKMARLFLLSDILHNSTAPVRNASRYRARLEELLPDIVESLQVGGGGGRRRAGASFLPELESARDWGRGWQRRRLKAGR